MIVIALSLSFSKHNVVFFEEMKDQSFDDMAGRVLPHAFAAANSKQVKIVPKLLLLSVSLLENQQLLHLMI
jgi:hypothetical protein